MHGLSEERNASTVLIEPFLAYCESPRIQRPTNTATEIIEISSDANADPDATVILSGSGALVPIITTNVAISTEISGRGTVLTKQVIYPSYPGELTTTAISTATTLLDGRSTVSTVYVTYTELPKPLFDDIPVSRSTLCERPILI